MGQLGSSHNIGTLAFNPAAAAGSTDSGALYVALGDGGSSNDPLGHGQRRSTPLGSILRIDPLGGGADSSYGIPSDNPFVGTSGALDEIWAYGLRHPQHFSFDSTGRMFINDIGQRSIEEVNLGVAGANYGWRLREGTFATAMGVGASDKRTVYPLPADDTGYTYPIAQYDHDEGDAIGAGFVYEGQAIPVAAKPLRVHGPREGATVRVRRIQSDSRHTRDHRGNTHQVRRAGAGTGPFGRRRVRHCTP